MKSSHDVKDEEDSVRHPDELDPLRDAHEVLEGHGDA